MLKAGQAAYKYTLLCCALPRKPARSSSSNLTARLYETDFQATTPSMATSVISSTRLRAIASTAAIPTCIQHGSVHLAILPRKHAKTGLKCKFAHAGELVESTSGRKTHLCQKFCLTEDWCIFAWHCTAVIDYQWRQHTCVGLHC